MNRVREMHENAVRFRDEGASIDAQNKAFDDCEDEFFRTEAFEDISDDEEGRPRANLELQRRACPQRGPWCQDEPLLYMRQPRTQQLRPEHEMRHLHVRNTLESQRGGAREDEDVVLRPRAHGVGTYCAEAVSA
jgi:hypothetical protein